VSSGSQRAIVILADGQFGYHQTSLIQDEEEAGRVVAETAAPTGLPADDPVRFGPRRLWSAIRPVVEALVP
jgi:uncharacterized NAD-dependent epimerase/dehydratase family protein